MGVVSSGELRSFVERIERIREEIKGLSSDLADIRKEAKGRGYCPKALAALIRLRAMDSADREQQDGILATYRAALGIGGADLEPTPLEAAIQSGAERATRLFGAPDEPQAEAA